MSPQPDVRDLTAEAEHAARRVSLYQQRLYAGKGDAKRLAELEREAEGAARRLRSARAGGAKPAEDGARRRPDLVSALQECGDRLRDPSLTHDDRMALLQRQAELGDLRDALALRARHEDGDRTRKAAGRTAT
jgi:hypothetical protein